MAKHVWVMQAIYRMSFEEAKRVRSPGNERPVDFGQHNLKEFRGPLCENCGVLFDLGFEYDTRGNRIETNCFRAAAISMPVPKVRFGGERPTESESLRESTSPISPDQPRLQEDHEGIGVARGSEGRELRQLPQRADPVGGTVLLPQGAEPVQQGEPDRTRSLSSATCFCQGACGDHGDHCRRRQSNGVYCHECMPEGYYGG